MVYKYERTLHLWRVLFPQMHENVLSFFHVAFCFTICMLHDIMKCLTYTVFIFLVLGAGGVG